MSFGTHGRCISNLIRVGTLKLSYQDSSAANVWTLSLDAVSLKFAALTILTSRSLNTSIKKMSIVR